MIDAPETIKMPVSVRLFCKDNGGWADECNLHNWKPYSGKLDWSGIEDSKDWCVEVIYDDGSDFPLAAVRIDGDDHAVCIIAPDGKLKTRLVTVNQIIPTVRVFVSTQVVRGGLKIGEKHFEQLGVVTTAKPPVMLIRRRIDCDE
jgi:hypothetical protein